MDKERGLVSIIVPVYNAEDYLHKCIDGVLAQTYTNWELLIIDDGSKDNSRKICENYATKDNRIIFIHKENSGVSDTRNIGIEHCTGDNICFVDADDWIKPKFLEHLMDMSEYDYVIAGYETWPENSRCTLIERTYKREELPEFFDRFLQTRPTSCATLFSTNIIKEHGIRFTSKLRSREDHLFNVQYLLWCNSASVINYQEYVVRSRQLPIAIKFRMHRVDIELVIDSLLEGYKNIEKLFGYKPVDLRPTKNVISQYYLEDFIRYNNDDDYYNLYCRYFDNSTRDEMYTNTSLSSMNLILDGIIAYRQVSNIDKMKELVDLFGRIYNVESLDKAVFRSRMHSNIAKAILNHDYQKARSIIDRVCIKIQIEYYLKTILRPFLYRAKAIFR